MAACEVRAPQPFIGDARMTACEVRAPQVRVRMAAYEVRAPQLPVRNSLVRRA